MSMSNPEVYSIFLHTTEGILYGDRDRSETQEARELLEAAAVAYLFSTDISLLRPMFRTKQLTCVGIEEIKIGIARLDETSEQQC